MPDPAFIVEGKMEQIIIQRLCPGKKVIQLNCNGDDVLISKVAEFIETQVRLFNNRYFPIILLLDREARQISSDEMAKQLLEELEKLGFQRDQFIVGIPDRCIENWVLAGEASILDYPDRMGANLKPNEGTKAKPILKRKLGDLYGETTDGVSLFLSGSVEKMTKNSPSFAAFLSQIGILNCPWINNRTNN